MIEVRITPILQRVFAPNTAFPLVSVIDRYEASASVRMQWPE